ncbi:MAG: hypothetical protein B7Z24_04730, partial [Pseudomonadales bacterium 32-42-5]
HTTQLSNLTASIAGKADTSALNALTVRVADEEDKSSSQATSITSLDSSVSDALKAVTVSDTRSTNEPPSWYWSNYSKRVVNEFKQTAAIGVSGFFGGTYCNLESKVYWTDSSGGDIIQTATSSVDPSLYVQRRSIGTAAWTAWVQPIKDLRDTLGTKASASAVSTLTTQVEDIDGRVSTQASQITTLTSDNTANGRVSTQASQITTLTSDNTANKNALQVQATVIDGVKANYMVKMETNGIIGGFGLIQSTGALGQVSTSFGVNADNFFIGAPAGGKKPFMVTTANQVVDGITYPAGTWINSAIIANATIGGAKIQNASIDTAQIKDAAITNAKIGNLAVTGAKIANATIGTAQIANLAVTGAKIANATIGSAHIADAAITSAKIGNAAITAAKIGDLEVSTLKIADNAVTITSGVIVPPPSYLIAHPTDYTEALANAVYGKYETIITHPFVSDGAGATRIEFVVSSKGMTASGVNGAVYAMGPSIPGTWMDIKVDGVQVLRLDPTQVTDSRWVPDPESSYNVTDETSFFSKGSVFTKSIALSAGSHTLTIGLYTRSMSYTSFTNPAGTGKPSIYFDEMSLTVSQFKK